MMLSSAYFVACVCAFLVMVSANSVIGSPPSLGSTSINVAGIAVIFGSFAAWWLTDRTRKENAKPELSIPNCDVLYREGSISVITRSEKMLKEKMRAIKEGGPEKLQVIADFDMTLTSFRLADGSRGMSTHGILERSGYLGAEFTARAKAIFDRFYPIEVDPSIPAAEKANAMSEWWETTHRLLIEQNITREDITLAVRGGHFAFRDGVGALLAQLEARKIPLLVFSAGLQQVVSEALEQRVGAFENVSVISNEMRFEARTGRLEGFANKTLHIMNKGAVALQGTAHAAKVASRPHVVLLGDSLGDLRMADGLPACDLEKKLTVGFLNDKIEARRAEYVAAFDVVLEGDASMALANDLVLAHLF